MNTYIQLEKISKILLRHDEHLKNLDKKIYIDNKSHETEINVEKIIKDIKSDNIIQNNQFIKQVIDDVKKEIEPVIKENNKIPVLNKKIENLNLEVSNLVKLYNDLFIKYQELKDNKPASSITSSIDVSEEVKEVSIENHNDQSVEDIELEIKNIETTVDKKKKRAPAKKKQVKE